MGVEKYVKNYLEMVLVNPQASAYPDIPFIYGSIELLLDTDVINIKEFEY